MDRAITTLDCRALYVRVKHLPSDAALWRVLESEQPEESQNGDPVKTNDPNKIAAFFEHHISG